MGKWQPFPIVGGAYTDDALPWTAQDTVNYLPVRAERAGGRSADKLEQVPGMLTFANVGIGPHRGGRDVEGKMFVVSGNKLYQVSTLGVATEVGTIPGTGLVSMTHNQITGGNELVIGNGSSGYVYNTKTSVFSQIGDVDFPGFVTADFINQYIVGVEPQRRFWFHSDLAAATDYGSLDQYEAESAPDRLVGGIASHSEYVAFGERTIEFFRNDPTSSSAFQRIEGVTAERGCANANTIKRLDNSVFFLADNGTVCKLGNGYTPVPVSTRALEAEIAKRDWTKAFAFTWEDRGHSVYYLTFQDGRTFGWDVAQEEWSRRESYGLTRWRLNTLFKWNGDWYGGDYNSGKLFRLDWDYALDACDPIERRRITGVTHNHQNRMFVSGIEVVMDTGNVESLLHAPPTLSGALPDGSVSDVVSYQYPITRAFPGQFATVTLLSGVLPTGLSINTAGLVTGTLTTTGTFSWTLRITDDCGETADLADSATIRSLFEMVAYTGNSTWPRTVGTIDMSGGGISYASISSGFGTRHLFSSGSATVYRLVGGGVTIPPTEFTFMPAGIRFNSSDGAGQHNWSALAYTQYLFRKAPGFVDVVVFTGTGAAQNIAHSLGIAPGCVVVRRLNSGLAASTTYHVGTGAGKRIKFADANQDPITDATAWDNTAPSTTSFRVGTSAITNNSGSTYVAILYAHNPSGIIQCGSYVGNGLAAGPIVSLGWVPRFIKILPEARNPDSSVLDTLNFPGLTGSESPRIFGGEIGKLWANYMDLTASGFQIKSADDWFNAVGATYCYIAVK